MQGRQANFGCYVDEAEACEAAVRTFRQYGPTYLHVYLRRAPQLEASQLPGSVHAAGPSRSQSSDSLSKSLHEGKTLLQRFLQATRDPCLAASLKADTPLLEAEPQQEQYPQQLCSESLQSHNTEEASARKLCSTDKGKTLLDSRYGLPPRLRRNVGSQWTRGYRARQVQAEPPMFVYEVDLRHLVSPQSFSRLLGMNLGMLA